MPSRRCPVCHEIVPSNRFENHRERHRTAMRDRQGTSGEWRRMRALCLERDGERCVICGTPGAPGNPLEVHHIDGDWRNNHIMNLETRCRTHHPRGQQKAKSF